MTTRDTHRAWVAERSSVRSNLGAALLSSDFFKVLRCSGDPGGPTHGMTMGTETVEMGAKEDSSIFLRYKTGGGGRGASSDDTYVFLWDEEA